VIALLRSELLRFRSRRLVKALAIIALIGTATIAVGIAVKSGSGSTEVFRLGAAREFVEGTAALFVIAGWLIGTSLVGAEWQAGTMTTLLTWEPRRSRVLATKALAAAIGVFVMVLVLNLIYLGFLALVAATRGVSDGLDPSLVWFIVRIAGGAAIGAVLGLSLATVTRNTGAAVGIAFVYLAIIEGIIRGVWPGWSGWLLGDTSGAFILMNGGELGRTVWQSAGVLAVWLTAFLAIAMTTLRTRDVG
jgi:ABC-type transport system involved in multi-copper enzyme maturation permease subunit